MWELEFSNNKNNRVIDPAGTKTNWYNKGANFWAVFQGDSHINKS